MPILLGSFAGATVSALLWEFTFQQFLTDFILAAFLFGGGMWVVKTANRHR